MSINNHTNLKCGEINGIMAHLFSQYPCMVGIDTERGMENDLRARIQNRLNYIRRNGVQDQDRNQVVVVNRGANRRANRRDLQLYVIHRLV